MNISQVIIESDSLELVSLWKTRNSHRASILPVKQIQELVEGCNYFDILHVNREANLAAQNIAKFASSSDPDCAWISQVPEYILQCTEQACNFGDN
jgi:hypothetical protein